MKKYCVKIVLASVLLAAILLASRIPDLKTMLGLRSSVNTPHPPIHSTLAHLVSPNSDAMAQEAADMRRNHLAAIARPSIVLVLDGYAGKFYWPDNQKTYNVRVGGISSGFFVNPKGSIVTNASTTKLTRDGENKGKQLLFANFVKQLAGDMRENPHKLWQDPKLRDQIEKKAKLVQFSPIHLVITSDGSTFPFKIGAFGLPDGQGRDVAAIEIEIEHAPALKFSNADRVQIQDRLIVVAAYSEDVEVNSLKQNSPLNVSFIDGKLAAKKNAADGTPIFQISMPAIYISSGGPVLNESGEVVGLLAYKEGATNSQDPSFSFVIPASTAMKYVKQAGTTNAQSEIDTLYREGLELHWQGRYREAIAKFEEVKQLFPQHLEATQLIQISQESIDKAQKNQNLPSWAIPVVLAGIAGTIYYTFRLRKLKPSARTASTSVVAREALDASEMQTEGDLRQPQQSLKPPLPKKANLPSDFAGSLPLYGFGDTPKPPPQTDIYYFPILKLCNSEGRVIQIPLRQESYRLGRDRDWSDIKLPDAGWEVVSRRHAILRKEGADYRIYDGDGQKLSSNGIFINNTSIDPVEGYLLQGKVEIQIGQDFQKKVRLTYFNPSSK